MTNIISVITPVYNMEKYLDRCVQSILNQDFSDFELILIDDGSSDSSGQLCDDYAKKDHRIKSFHIANGGPSKARNFGLRQCTGKWVTFIDSDDWVDSRYLSTLFKIIDVTDSDIAMCNYKKTNSEILNNITDQQIVQEFPKPKILEQFFGRYHSYLVTATCKLYKIDLLLKHQFPEGRLHEDAFLTYQIFADAKKVSLTESTLYYYWKHSDSITGRFYISRQIDNLEALLARAEFFKLQKLDVQYNKQINAVIEQYFRTIRSFSKKEIKPVEEQLEYIYSYLKNIHSKNVIDKKWGILLQFYKTNRNFVSSILFYSNKFINLTKRS